ncbi:MAG TPA: hypothetical protein VFA09_12290 [Ktedonobacteraceae bacterium]|jgi:hypothetical protein|nr:hypothetical protein [Ktedonobacteraceae bacterium]
MQQQQHANYDLLAVFNDETKAETAETKLRNAGFGDDEVFRLGAEAVTGAQFREHGPNRDRSAIFLQTTRSGPNPVAVVALAILFGVILGALMFSIADFEVKTIPLFWGTLAGVVVGIIIGAIIGLRQRGRVRGAIGQDLSRVNTPIRSPEQGARTVVAVRLPDPDNISRKSKARAILLNNGGKIDRSVGG